MPRTRRPATISGAPAQPTAPVPGQTYGMGVEQQQLAEAMPSPQARPSTPDASSASMAVPPPAAGASAGGPTPAPSPDAVRAEQFQAALAAAQQLKGKAGMLRQPTGRPNEPVTAGLSIGPGPGPEALGMPRGNPTGNTLRKLAAATGDSYLRELAERAGL